VLSRFLYTAIISRFFLPYTGMIPQTIPYFHSHRRQLWAAIDYTFFLDPWCPVRSEDCTFCFSVIVSLFLIRFNFELLGKISLAHVLVSQVEKIPVFCEMCRFITVFKTTYSWSVYRAVLMQSTSSSDSFKVHFIVPSYRRRSIPTHSLSLLRDCQPQLCMHFY